MDISIIIVSYNTREGLRRCLAALPEAAAGREWEAVVVDNASTDGSADMVRRDFPKATLIAHPENAGFGRACNLGYRASQGRYILLLNSDAFAPAGSLARLAGYMDAHPDIGAAGPRLTGTDGAQARSAFRFPSLGRPLFNFNALAPIFGETFAVPYPRAHPLWNEGGPVDWLSGACVILRREAFLAAGLFDERYFMYFEDADLGKRLRAAGWPSVFWPGAEVLHEGGASARKNPGRLAFEEQRSRLIYFTTHTNFFTRTAIRKAMALSALWRAARNPARWRTEADIFRLALFGHKQGGPTPRS